MPDYQKYITKFLSTEEIRTVNRDAVKNGMRYCNALCQELRHQEEFHGKNIQYNICKKCKEHLTIAAKKIKAGLITLEQFKENANIIYNEEINISTTRKCNSCQQTKILNEFELNKKQCKACRYLHSVKTSNEAAQQYIKDIEKIKLDFTELEKLLRQIPKNTLILIITHYQVGRKATDSKDIMVSNTLERFKQFSNPKLCSGYCGTEVKEDFSICENCNILSKVRKENHIEKMKTFDDNVDEIVEKLTEIKDETYNKQQIIMIAKKLNIKPINTMAKKEVIVKKINDALKQREEEVKKEIKEEKKNLVLNDIIVLAREDGFINATALCKAGGTNFANWYRLDKTKELIKFLENDLAIHGIPGIENKSDIQNHISSEVGIPTSQLIDIKKGGNSSTQGSWIHPDLAVQLAQWISTEFAVQVSRWIREMAITGSASINSKKTDKQLLQLQEENALLKSEIKTITKTHRALLYKKSYHKLKVGKCFYIIFDPESAVKKYKIGNTDDINIRLAQYRTSNPRIKLVYLVYTEDNELLEKNILSRYKECRQDQKNHEVIYGIDLDHIIKSVETNINFNNFDAIIDKEFEEYNNEN